MYSPKISIIIPVYNGKNFLRKAIDSALAQTYKNIEVIVVNDGSSDDTKSIMDSYGDVIISIHKQNGGVSSALNLGIQKMSGEYFAWLSHDDVLKPDACDMYISLLQECDRETVIYSNYDIIDKDGKVYNSTNFEAIYSLKELEMSVYPVISGFVNGCACLIHKNHFKRVGLFDESLKITQDNDMWFRIFRNSKIKFCTEIVSSKRYHPEQDSKTKNVYPDEDLFLYNCLKELTIPECVRFGGGVSLFFETMKSRVSYDKHPKTTALCEKMLKEAENGKIYERLNTSEIMEILLTMDRTSRELKADYKRLQSEITKLITRF